MAEKVKVSKVIKSINRILGHQNTNISELVQLNSAINALWDEVRDNIETEEVTQEQCVEMVQLLNRFHVVSKATDYGGIGVHTLMHTIQPGNINEGGKCGPWNPDC